MHEFVLRGSQFHTQLRRRSEFRYREFDADPPMLPLENSDLRSMRRRLRFRSDAGQAKNNYTEPAIRPHSPDWTGCSPSTWDKEHITYAALVYVGYRVRNAIFFVTLNGAASAAAVVGHGLFLEPW